jgi:hypothetical protein
MGTLILGWLLIVVGQVAILAGLVGGITTMFQEIRRKATQGQSFGVDPLPTEFIKALTELVNALKDAPTWLALVIIGLVLVGWGAVLI